MRQRGILLIGAAIAAAMLSETVRADEWIVVAPKAAEPVLKPLMEHRRRTGLRVHVVHPEQAESQAMVAGDDIAPLVKQIREIARSRKEPCYVLLVGVPFAERGEGGVTATRPAGGTLLLPAGRGQRVRMKGQPTDAPFGLPDAEGVPAIAVGRMPARDLDELRGMVDKTLGWERDAKPGPWKRRFVLLAGMPSYNPVVDRLVESTAMSELARLGPHWSGNAIYYNENSPFTLPDDQIADKTQAYVGEGQILTVFLGHSLEDGVWHVPTGTGRWKPLFGSRQFHSLRMPAESGIFVTTGCLGCCMGGERDEGYGVWAVRNAHGPVAAIGAHEACWASMAFVFSRAMLDAAPGPFDAPRLGDVWMDMKHRLTHEPINPLLYHALDKVDGDPNTPQAEQRREHQEMFMLFGDPALRLPGFEHRLEVNVTGDVKPGATFEVSGPVPSALAKGTGRVSISRPLTVGTTDLKVMPDSRDGAGRRAAMLYNHATANAFTLVEAPVAIRDGNYSARLTMPERLPSPSLIVRVIIVSHESDGLGVLLQASPSEGQP